MVWDVDILLADLTGVDLVLLGGPAQDLHVKVQEVVLVLRSIARGIMKDYKNWQEYLGVCFKLKVKSFRKILC